MTTVDLEEIADDLYSRPPEDFTRARDEAARAATDPDLRKAVKALRRPTAAAHEVNRLTRDRPDDIDALVSLGDRLREAMRGDPREVRRLTEERRDLIAALVDAALATGVQQEVTATLEAATADPDLGTAVRSGRLVKPLRYAGFGSMPDLGDALATPVTSKPPRRATGAAKATTTTASSSAKKTAAGTKPDTKAARKAAAKAAADDARRVQQAQADLAAARQHVLELAGAADDAQRRYDEAARAVQQARSLLEAAEQERAAAHKAAREAHQAAEKARRELGRLERL